VTPRNICLVVMKTSPGPHWGKLLKAAGKPPHFVKVDWSKYKDEEEEETEGQGARVACACGGTRLDGRPARACRRLCS
jgi:hypothetical protein